MKFLIAGYGSIGRRHFRNLRQLGQDDILFYRTRKSSLKASELKDYTVEYDLQKALSHNPDAVIVSNPTSLHLDVALPAAEAGCAILVEKPLSHSMDRVKAFVHIVEEQNVKVLVGFQFRFHPGLQKVDHLLQEGRIGDVLSVRAHWGEYLPDWHPWEDYRRGYSARKDLGGGVILTLSHPIDYLRWLMGEIDEVYCMKASNSNLDIEVEDTAEINLRFRDGAIGSIHLNYNQKPPSHWLEIIGNQGTIRWDYYKDMVKVFKSSTGLWETFPLPGDFKRNDLFLSEMNHFLSILKENRVPVCSLFDGVRVQEIIEGVKLSADKGRSFKV